MTDTWVNAVLEITVPLSVEAAANDDEKRRAVAETANKVFDAVAELDLEWVGTERWEDVSD